MIFIQLNQSHKRTIKTPSVNMLLSMKNWLSYFLDLKTIL